MATTIEVADAQARLVELVAQASAGEEFVLVEHGKPKAKLLAVSGDDESAQTPKPRTLGMHEGNIVYMSDDFLDPLPEDTWNVYGDQ
jgi:prevent-host-death family protein